MPRTKGFRFIGVAVILALAIGIAVVTRAGACGISMLFLLSAGAVTSFLAILHPWPRGDVDARETESLRLSAASVFLFLTGVVAAVPLLLRESPLQEFERVVLSPAPPSLRVVRAGRSPFAMNRDEWACHFTIAPGDFDVLLRKHELGREGTVTPELVSLAKELCDADLRALGLTVVYQVDLSEPGSTTWRKVVVTNEGRDRCVFFSLAYD